jgi:methionyl-tRNA formyltransferase
MKFVYFGSSKFSEIVLEALWRKKYKPTLVITRPDKPKGRGLKVSTTHVSNFALENAIPCLKPKTLKDKSWEEKLKAQEADFFIVADYGGILTPSVLALPKIFSLCLHPSLLPAYRGASPIEQALIDGCKETGSTIFRINEKIDAGDVILKETLTIDEGDGFFSLREKLAKSGTLTLIKALKMIESKKYTLTPQDASKATLTQKLKKEDGRISWDHPAKAIKNLIRATEGWPSAYTYYQDLRLKILSVDIVEETGPDKPGTITAVEKNGIYVQTAKNSLRIKKLQPQGKKEMTAWAFVCGHRIKPGEHFS